MRRRAEPSFWWRPEKEASLTEAVGDLSDAHVLAAHGHEVVDRGVVAALCIGAEELQGGGGVGAGQRMEGKTELSAPTASGAAPVRPERSPRR